MRLFTFVWLTATLGSPALAQQVQVNVQLPIPTITFGVPPPLVVVQPGIQVVQDYDEEVFFVDNYYWVRRGPHWYRTSHHRGDWVVVDGPRVPRGLVRLPTGQYRRFHPGRTVVIDPPGPGRIKIKHGKGKWRD